MQVQWTDFNGIAEQIAKELAPVWKDVADVLTDMPLHLKASDQAGLQGSPIFDPVGTNSYIARELAARSWMPKVAIAAPYRFLGTDVDFIKSGMLLEVQFSNYPFLWNNVLRAELFFKARTHLAGIPVDALAVVTKGHMFPSSQSTLYYEQANNQLSALIQHNVFDVPIRLIGLFETPGTTVEAVFTEYHTARYSRTVVRRTDRDCQITTGRTRKGRCGLRLL